MPDQVFLARHGETVWNVAGRRQGRLDSPLTRTGIRQARGLAEAAAGWDVDALFTSPLGRASRTAAVLAHRLTLPVTVLDGLREVDHGRSAGLTTRQMHQRFPELAQARRRDRYTARFPGGESYRDADARAGEALTEVAGSGARRPLLVTHKMLSRLLLRHLLGLDVPAALALDHPHDVVHAVDPRTASHRVLTVPP